MSETRQKVLIVDDSETNLALLEHTLAALDCDIVQADSGAKAVELVRNNDFALVLLDIQMPEMNGYETASRIKGLDRGKHVPIIFITAIFQDEEYVRQGYETGAVDYLFRPVNLNMLKGKVQVFLGMHRQKIALEEELERRSQSQEATSKDEEKYRSLFERAVEGIFRADLEGRITEANPAMARLLGYDDAEDLLTLENMHRAVMVDCEACEEYLDTLRRDGFMVDFEFRARRKDGEIIWCSESSRLVARKDGAESVEGVLKDITAQKNVEMELQYRASVDPLTQIANRQLFFDRTEKALANARRHGLMAAILFIDLNEFKAVNDTYGHQAGDELLKEVAKRLGRRTREADTLGRLGGDEFGVLLTTVDGETAVRGVAESLLDVLDEPFVLAGETVSVGATVGSSLFPKDGEDGKTLVSRADAAMYNAKRRNDVRYISFRECENPQ